jgi:hypothetical protein
MLILLPLPCRQERFAFVLSSKPTIRTYAPTTFPVFDNICAEHFGSAIVGGHFEAVGSFFEFPKARPTG